MLRRIKKFAYHAIKHGFFSKAVQTCKLDDGLTKVMCYRHKNNFIRAVNYHDIPADCAETFDRHLAYYRENYSPVSLADLDRFFENQVWNKEKPGLILSFDDGFRSHYDTVYPTLEKYGFTGWFLVPTEFVATPGNQQIPYAESHRISYCNNYNNGRIALSVEELRELDRGHVIVSHTRTHRRLGKGVDAAELEQEIIQSKKELEELVGHPINVFGWVGGEVESYSKAAAEIIRKAGYKYSFMTKSAPVTCSTDPHQMHRTNIEADTPVEDLNYQLCGLPDFFNMPHRIYLSRLT